MASLWVKIEANMVDHPKMITISGEAKWSFVEMLLYCQAQLTNGFIDERVAHRKWSDTAINELTTNDATNPTLYKVEGGYQIHDYCEYQRSSEEVVRIKEAKRAAGAKGGIASGEARRSKIEAESKQNLSKTKPDTDTDTDTDINTSLSELKSSDEKIFSEEVYSLCDELAQLIRANGNKVGTVGVNWWKAADRLIRLDGHSLELIEQVMYWSQANEFWQGNILSMPKFREQFDKLRTRMQNEKPKQVQYSGYAPGVVTRGEAPEGRRYAADIIEDWNE